MDLKRVAREGCCTAEQLQEFKDLVCAKISKAPNWTSGDHNPWVSSCANILGVCGMCSCKLIVLGWRIDDQSIWRVIMTLAKTDISQRRVIGEVYGHWDEVVKLGTIFHKPYNRDGIWPYAMGVDKDDLWVLALQTGCLKRPDVKMLAKHKSGWEHWTLGVPLMAQNLLTDTEALRYLRLLQNYCLTPAVEWARVREFRREELFNVAEHLGKFTSPYKLFEFWTEVLQKLDHRFDRNLLLRVLEQEQGRHERDLSEISGLVAAAIRTRLLTRADRQALRRVFRDPRINEALLDVA